jgi:hypothetical protein
MCRFPGSQPISFGVRDLDKLETQEYATKYCFPSFKYLTSLASTAIGSVKNLMASEYYSSSTQSSPQMHKQYI